MGNAFRTLVLIFGITLGTNALAVDLPDWLSEEAVNGQFSCRNGSVYTISTEDNTLTHEQNGSSTIGYYDLRVDVLRVVFALKHTWLIFWKDGDIETLFQYRCENLLPE